MKLVSTESFDQSVRVDDSQAPTTYFGFSPLGSDESRSVWKIKRLSIVNSVTKIEYADGNDLYDNVWANRYSLIYS